MPPDTKVENFGEAVTGVGELALMDDEAGVELAGDDGGDDLVKGDGDGFYAGSEELER